MAGYFAGVIAALFIAAPAFAQSVEVNDQGETVEPQQSQQPQYQDPSTQTGKQKADQYFQQRKPVRRPSDSQPPAAGPDGPTPRYLAIHMGTFLADQSYKWGSYDQNQSGFHGFNAGVTYRLGEWVNSMDFNIRIEYTGYTLDNGDAKKLSFVPMLTFPDANSRFPLYFGGGLGAGMFIQQVHDRSPIALDWQVVAGVRVRNVFDKVGLMVETGLKNHVMLLSPGQYNGLFINIGCFFTF